MHNLNEYNQEEFEEQFKETELFQKIKKNFDLVIWDKHAMPFNMHPTLRQTLGIRICTLASFYYLQFLLEKNPDSIFDIGCGWNLFKKFIPEIVGISPDVETDPSYYGDSHDFFDQNFVMYNEGQFESAMSICALNYAPLTQIKEIVEGFVSLVSPGGRGYIALDISPMLQREDADVLNELFGTADPSYYEIDDYVRDQLSNLPCKYLVFDLDSMEYMNEIDGTVRIVFEKPTE
jgi:hypothetical protein